MTTDEPKRIRILEARLRRSEENRVRLEEKTARSESLFRKIILQMQDTEGRLRASEAAALEAMRARSEFLANVTHEIRTPLMGVLGSAELLRDTGTTTDTHLCDLKRSAQLLRGIVDDILDYSKFESGHMHLRSIEVDLRFAIEDAMSTILPAATAQGVVLVAEMEVHPLVNGDPTRLRQVFLNLIGNAVKFTPSGSVTIQVALTEASGAPTVVVRVIDTGVGFPPEASERIFEPFRQEDGTTTRAHGGTGLGLAICRKIVTAHGGMITGAPRPEGGSVFTLLLPTQGLAPAVQAAQPAARRTTSFADMAVLLTEDNLINQQVIKAMLELAGVEVTLAPDGLVAIELGFERSFDLLLIDLHMPRADGVTVVERLRSDPRSCNSLTPMVAITAGGLAREVDRAFAAGLNEMLYKPFNQAQLDELLVRYAPRPLPVLDNRVFQSLASLLPTRVGALVDQFAGDGEDLAAWLPTASPDERRTGAHSSRGAAKQLGAGRLGRLLEQIEAQTEGPVQQDIVARLRREWGAAVQAMRGQLDGQR